MEMDKLQLIKKIFYKKASLKQLAGFTLVEVIVSLAIFMLFITISLSMLIVSNNSSKKATNIKTAVDNIQYSMEMFTRTARLGTMYTCFAANQTSVPMSTLAGIDCDPGQGVAFFVLDPTVTPNQTDAYSFYLENSTGTGQVMRCVDRNVFPGGVITTTYAFQLWPGNKNCAGLTAKEIDVDMFDLIVDGTSTSDSKQPGIKVKISGILRTNDDQTPFYLQTFISQRQYE